MMFFWFNNKNFLNESWGFFFELTMLWFAQHLLVQVELGGQHNICMTIAHLNFS